MKTTVMTIALALGGMTMFAAQTPAPAVNGTNKPAATKAVKTTKKHHNKAVKKTTKVPAAAPAPAAGK